MSEALQAILADPAVVRISDAFHAAGHELYLVGGCVRDLVLRRSPGDLDFTTDARPDVIEALLGPLADALWTVGRAFGTVAASIGGHNVEITTYRDEIYTPASRKPEVTFGDSLLEDLRRRDFTCNAMAIRIPDGELVDPYGGIGDLAAGKLVCPRSAEAAFDEDPLRMLRAARFVSQLNLEPSRDVRDAAATMAARLEIVSVERIRDEFSKICMLAEPTAAMWFLVDTGLLDCFAPEIPAMRVEQDPIHRHKDVLTHSIAVMRKTSPRLELRLAAIFHDVGKPRTRSIGPKGVQFHHHDAVGARMARKRLQALRYPNEIVDVVTDLVALHLRVHTYKMGWTDSAVRRYVRDAGPNLDALNELVRCDCTTRSKKRAEELQTRMDELEERIAELREHEELAALRPALDGRAVMQLLDLAPGPDVGKALGYLMELRLEEGELDADDAEHRLIEWWATQAGSNANGRSSATPPTGVQDP